MDSARREEMMPLTRRQFELGVDTETENWMRSIYGFSPRIITWPIPPTELFEEVAHNDSSVSAVFQRAMGCSGNSMGSGSAYR